jgi:two-component system nitrate/nitrite response regulator NarL
LIGGKVRVAILTPIRLLGEAIGLALGAREAHLETIVVRRIEELRALLSDNRRLELVIVDTSQTFDLDAIRCFHREWPDLPLLALGLREQEAEIVAHGSAGFSCYLCRDEGLDQLCVIVHDAVEGRLNCSPEIAAAIMRALFRSGPLPMPTASAQLTRREYEVAQLVARALSNKEIARELELSESTVKHHVHSILGKVGASTRGQLMRNMRQDLWSEEVPVRMLDSA